MGRLSSSQAIAGYPEIQKELRLKTVPNPNVFVHPGDPEYWYTDKDYLNSLLRIGDAEPATFRSPGTKPKPPPPCRTPPP